MEPFKLVPTGYQIVSFGPLNINSIWSNSPDDSQCRSSSPHLLTNSDSNIITWDDYRLELRENKKISGKNDSNDKKKKRTRRRNKKSHPMYSIDKTSLKLDKTKSVSIHKCIVRIDNVSLEFYSDDIAISVRRKTDDYDDYIVIYHSENVNGISKKYSDRYMVHKINKDSTICKFWTYKHNIKRYLIEGSVTRVDNHIDTRINYHKYIIHIDVTISKYPKKN